MTTTEIPTRPFGPVARVPVIGQGTWQMEHDDRASAIAAIRRGLDLGLTHIDTAELYGKGRVEELVGEAISGRRSTVFLVSKVVPFNASKQGTIRACDRSLERLRTNYLDSYLLHWPSDHPLEETVAAFEDLEKVGKIRSWGVSNFDEIELEAAVRIAGPGKVACNQVLYHLRERAIEHAVAPACERLGVALVAYSPFGSGDFPADHPILKEIADAHDASPYQVALAFLAAQTPALLIPKAATVSHVEDNAAAATLVLSVDERERLDRAFPRGPRRRGVPTL